MIANVSPGPKRDDPLVADSDMKCNFGAKGDSEPAKLNTGFPPQLQLEAQVNAGEWGVTREATQRVETESAIKQTTQRTSGWTSRADELVDITRARSRTSFRFYCLIEALRWDPCTAFFVDGEGKQFLLGTLFGRVAIYDLDVPLPGLHSSGYPTATGSRGDDSAAYQTASETPLGSEITDPADQQQSRESNPRHVPGRLSAEDPPGRLTSGYNRSKRLDWKPSLSQLPGATICYGAVTAVREIRRGRSLPQVVSVAPCEATEAAPAALDRCGTQTSLRAYVAKAPRATGCDSNVGASQQAAPSVSSSSDVLPWIRRRFPLFQSRRQVRPLEHRMANLLTIPGHLHVLTAFSDDAIKATVIHDGTFAHAVVGNTVRRTWNLQDCSDQATQTFERVLATSNKYVLQHEHEVFIPTTGLSLVIDLSSGVTRHCSFRLPPKNVLPTDFDGKHLLLFYHRSEEQPRIQIFELPIFSGNPQWGLVPVCCFSESFPMRQQITHLKFWGPNYIVYVLSGWQVVVQAWRTEELKFRQSGVLRRDSEIVGVDVSQADRLISLASNGSLFVWSSDGTVQALLQLEYVTFDNGFPSLMKSCGDSARWVVLTADQGLFLLDLYDFLPPRKQPNPLPPGASL